LACVSNRVALSVTKSGTSAARVSRRNNPGPAVFGSNGPDRHSLRICRVRRQRVRAIWRASGPQRTRIISRPPWFNCQGSLWY
jgi:hypothetical protein